MATTIHTWSYDSCNIPLKSKPHSIPQPKCNWVIFHPVQTGFCSWWSISTKESIIWMVTPSLRPICMTEHPIICCCPGHLTKRRDRVSTPVQIVWYDKWWYDVVLPWNLLHFWKANCFHLKCFQMSIKLWHSWREHWEENSLCMVLGKGGSYSRDQVAFKKSSVLVQLIYMTYSALCTYKSRNHSIHLLHAVFDIKLIL